MVTSLCDKVCQLLAASLWFSLGTLKVSSVKTDHHDVIEIILKVVLEQPLSSLPNILIQHEILSHMENSIFTPRNTSPTPFKGSNINHFRNKI